MICFVEASSHTVLLFYWFLYVALCVCTSIYIYIYICMLMLNSEINYFMKYPVIV